MKKSHQIGIVIGISLSCLSLLSACLIHQAPNHLAASNNQTNAEQPSWLSNIIAQAEKQPHLLQAIYTLEHQNKQYYMTVPGCCDRFSDLYDTDGQKICSPSGGFTGRGDGQCGNIDVRGLPKTKIWPKKSA